MNKDTLDVKMDEMSTINNIERKTIKRMRFFIFVKQFSVSGRCGKEPLTFLLYNFFYLTQ